MAFDVTHPIIIMYAPLCLHECVLIYTDTLCSVELRNKAVVFLITRNFHNVVLIIKDDNQEE